MAGDISSHLPGNGQLERQSGFGHWRNGVYRLRAGKTGAAMLTEASARLFTGSEQATGIDG